MQDYDQLHAQKFQKHTTNEKICKLKKITIKNIDQ